jgi:hypothetical protein
VQKDVIFVIPTYRLRDVGDTVEQYDDHFWRNGHSVRMIVFDDSTPSTQEKYYPLLEQTRTHNDVFYVGLRKRNASSVISISASATSGSKVWCVTSFARAMAAIGTIRSCTRSGR